MKKISIILVLAIIISSFCSCTKVYENEDASHAANMPEQTAPIQNQNSEQPTAASAVTTTAEEQSNSPLSNTMQSLLSSKTVTDMLESVNSNNMVDNRRFYEDTADVFDKYYGEDNPTIHTSGDYEYIVYDNNTCAIYRYLGHALSVTVPSEIDGYTVKCIYQYAFENKILLRSIKLPNTIEVLLRYAFAYCVALQDVELPDSITIFDDGIFTSCTSLKSIKLPQKLIGIPGGVFYDCIMLENVEYNMDNLYYISTNAFHNCRSLKSFTYPKNGASIGAYAFSDCTALETIVLHDNIITIGPGAFYNCKSLKLDKLPESTQYIGSFAFANCTNIRDLKCPKSISSLNDLPFVNCKNINLQVPAGSFIAEYAAEHNIRHTVI